MTIQQWNALDNIFDIKGEHTEGLSIYEHYECVYNLKHFKIVITCNDHEEWIQVYIESMGSEIMIECQTLTELLCLCTILKQNDTHKENIKCLKATPFPHSE